MFYKFDILYVILHALILETIAPCILTTRIPFFINNNQV